MHRAVLFAVSFWLLVFLAVAQIAILRGRWSAPALGLEQWLVLIVILALQAMLLIVPSRLGKGLPVGGGFLLVPLTALGFLFAVLLFSIEMAFGEYTRLLNDASIWTVVFPLVAGIGYAFVLHRKSRRMAAERLLRHQCWTLLIAGALVLAAIIPAHLMTIRRGGFLVGIGTALGIILSVLVILLALGQLLFSLLYARSTSRRTQPPEAPAPPTHA